jgi:magnesium-transporting ATPase (P-type)
MVGDGVNDVPAMKAARLGIALGSGAQIARGVSDIVLVSDEFGAIPRGIEEGRRILANIRRVAKLFVVKSAFAATLILTVGLWGVAYPLLPRHLSLAATFTVGVPAFVLALAPSTGKAPGLDFIRDLLRFSVPGGVCSAFAVLAAYSATRSLPDHDVADARTVAFLVLVLTGLYLVLLLESEAMRASRIRAGSVIALMGALVAGLVAVFWIQPIRDFFALMPLDAVEVLLAILALCFTVGALGLAGLRSPLVARLFGDR